MRVFIAEISRLELLLISTNKNYGSVDLPYFSIFKANMIYSITLNLKTNKHTKNNQYENLIHIFAETQLAGLSPNMRQGVIYAGVHNGCGITQSRLHKCTRHTRTHTHKHFPHVLRGWCVIPPASLGWPGNNWEHYSWLGHQLRPRRNTFVGRVRLIMKVDRGLCYIDTQITFIYNWNSNNLNDSTLAHLWTLADIRKVWS